MDVRSLIKERLEDLGIEQKDLASAAGVTESYISQLLTRKKPPPASDRTDIYERMAKFLKLPHTRLAELADLQRKQELMRKLENPPGPLFKEVREVILTKCSADTKDEVRAIFEKQPFGELERFVTQKLLDVVTELVKEELENESWMRLVARVGGRTHEQLRVIVLEFLDTDIFNLSPEHCTFFLEPLIESWRMDLTTFGMEVVLSRRLARKGAKRFEFVEMEPQGASEVCRGLEDFLGDPCMSGDVTEEETAFLRSLKLGGKQPTSLYYYRELQNLRDPLHFHRRESSVGRHRNAGRPRGGNKRRLGKLRPRSKQSSDKGSAGKR